MRLPASILGLLLMVLAWTATAQTNYFCIVCGKGPLTNHAWMYPWGPVCDDCQKLETRCSLCGLPIKDGDGSVKTGDGRFICRFDKTNSILTVDQARELFESTKDEVVDMFGQGFALQNQEITVNLFDVDYWSEKGREDGLHKFGFASSRPAPGGTFTHEVVMLSGRRLNEMTATAAHEYTHLWINENRPQDRIIDADTIEAICELTAYKLMQQKNLPEMQQRILDNPYTHGRIKTLVQVEADHGIAYILNWVKNGSTPNFDTGDSAPELSRPTVSHTGNFTATRPTLPNGLKYTGLLVIGNSRLAIINGVSLGVADTRSIPVLHSNLVVRCQRIDEASVTIQVLGMNHMLTLTRDQEYSLP